MKVFELIDLLRSYDPEQEVVVDDGSDSKFDIVDVDDFNDQNDVWLITEPIEDYGVPIDEYGQREVFEGYVDAGDDGVVRVWIAEQSFDSGDTLELRADRKERLYDYRIGGGWFEHTVDEVITEMEFIHRFGKKFYRTMDHFRAADFLTPDEVFGGE